MVQDCIIYLANTNLNLRKEEEANTTLYMYALHGIYTVYNLTFYLHSTWHGPKEYLLFANCLFVNLGERSH